MIPFEEVICQLILRHNCVVVPHFGGFVSKTIAAQIDFEKGIIQAPFKQLLFNRNLINDDGLVLAEYARLNGLYYQEGASQLVQFTSQLNTDLSHGKQVSIPKLGIFSKDADGVVRFEQDRHFNMLLSSYGLTNVTFVPNQILEETPIIELNPEINNLENEKTSSKFWKYAAAACLLPGPARTGGKRGNFLGGMKEGHLEGGEWPGRLRQGIEYGVDYELVPREAFKALKAWYGGGPEIERSS